MLDLDQSVRGHANENFSRELLELFTLEGTAVTRNRIWPLERPYLRDEN